MSKSVMAQAVDGWFAARGWKVFPFQRAVLACIGFDLGAIELKRTVSTAQHRPREYDYYGFPEHTYHIKYPASRSAAKRRNVFQESKSWLRINTESPWNTWAASMLARICIHR